MSKDRSRLPPSFSMTVGTQAYSGIAPRLAATAEEAIVKPRDGSQSDQEQGAQPWGTLPRRHPPTFWQTAFRRPPASGRPPRSQLAGCCWSSSGRALMDPIAARHLFPLTSRYIFMNHAGVSPLSERGRAALASLIEEQATKPHLNGANEEMAERLRSAISRLVGADADTIGITRGTAHAVSLLAQGLDWREGDNVVGA